MEYIVLIIFSLLLFLCIVLNISILWALFAGFILFGLYGIIKGFKIKEILHFSFLGIKTVKNILITFLLIGIMTALWREAGTIPMIVCLAANFIQPTTFLLMTFLLNCLISVLTGTAFGTAATMGVICSTIGMSLGVSPIFIGGAVLSGAYFGDRCSFVSTSALLVATLTKTDIFINIKNMIRSSLIPFLISCLIYTSIGFIYQVNGSIPNLTSIFEKEFNLTFITILPAFVLLVLAMMKVNVKIAMSVSILVALPICIIIQNTSIFDIPSLMVFGYISQDSQIAVMLNGGGIISMLKVISIVCLSSAYSGIFQETKLLDGIKVYIQQLAQKTTPYISTLLTSIITSMITCNQTLSIMLTEQICRDNENDHYQFALSLENSAVVIPPLIPWSIASGVTLSSVNAPISSIIFACFLYLVPLWNCIVKNKA